MKLTLLAFTVAGLLAAAGAPQIFNGVITDTMCGGKHGMMKGQPDGECALLCVRGSREYALYDGSGVWKLSDQKTPARFAGMKVKVTGVANEQSRTIKVTSIEAAQ
jgi:hypothetical protein